MTIRPLLLGFTVPDALADRLFALDPMPAVQTHRFAWSLARSIRHGFGEVRLLSTAPVQNYPIVRRLGFRGGRFAAGGIEGTTLGFVNLLVLKHVTRFLACLFALPRVLGGWRINAVFIHGVHTPFLLYGYVLGLFGVKVVPVLTDLPGIVLPTDSRLARILKRLDRRVVGFFLRRATAVVALAPDLVAHFPGLDRTLIVPGIVNQEWLDLLEAATPSVKTADTPTVLYAGGLSAAYGIDRLLDGAAAVPEVRLRLFGKGDQVPRVERGGIPNISYGGFASAAELAREVLAAAILVNPRPTDTRFAQASFPSKLLEYAAAGRTVLTTRIPSIPADLAPWFAYIEDESAAGIADAIRREAARPAAERSRAADQARQIAIREYSESALGAKLAALLA